LRRPEKETDFPTMNKLGYGRNLFGIVTTWWIAAVSRYVPKPEDLTS
jgi:hypothetical protein